VPITADVVSAIRMQAALVRKAFGEYENPKRYLFPSPHPRCIGLPIRANAVTHAFHRFVTRCGIVGADGRPFRLRAHAFRHTKAVELINNGMGMSYVQQWLAHLSPEMTLVYARVSEDTMRKQWEEAMARGAVHVASAGPQPIDPNELIAGNELELAYIRGSLDATRVEAGYCFKPLKMECPFVDIACFTCHNHVTTNDFLPQFRRQEHDLLEQIHLGRAAGRPHWVDRTEQKLRAVQAIIDALDQQRVHGLPKAQRESDRPTERSWTRSAPRARQDERAETRLGAQHQWPGGERENGAPNPRAGGSTTRSLHFRDPSQRINFNRGGPQPKWPRPTSIRSTRCVTVSICFGRSRTRRDANWHPSETAPRRAPGSSLRPRTVTSGNWRHG
jgi:hypothetical protein